MAHEIEGNKAFYVTTPAWHGLGHVLTNAPSIEDAWKLAYPHTLFKLDLEAIITDSSGSVQRMPLKNSKVIVRDDGVEFKAVGSDFELVQPYEVLNTFRPLLDSKLVELEAGGSLRNGSQMWALGKVKNADADILPGDHVKGYVLMYTGFDGSLRVGLSQTNVRVVCANTLAASMSETKGNSEFKFKHTRNVRLRVDSAVNTIQRTLEQFQQNVNAYKKLTTKLVNDSQMKTYVRNVLLTDAEKAKPAEISARKTNTVNSVIDLLDTQRGLELVPAMRGTAWQAYNAVSQYLTHDVGRSVDTRLQSQWFGESAQLNTKALEMALAM